MQPNDVLDAIAQLPGWSHQEAELRLQAVHRVDQLIRGGDEEVPALRFISSWAGTNVATLRLWRYCVRNWAGDDNSAILMLAPDEPQFSYYFRKRLGGFPKGFVL